MIILSKTGLSTVLSVPSDFNRYSYFLHPALLRERASVYPSGGQCGFHLFHELRLFGFQ